MNRPKSRTLRYSMYAVITVFVLLITLVAYAQFVSETTYIYPPFKHTWGVVRATPAKLFMLVGNRAKFAQPAGLACVRMDSWEDPKIAGDDDEVTVYGVNTGQNTIIYNKSMYELGIYGDREKGAGKLNSPWAVAANNKGDVYVTDANNHRVVRLFNPKSELKFVSAFGELGTANGQFNKPTGIALDNNGFVYIADYLNNRVQIFNDKNEYVSTIFDTFAPVGLAVIDGSERWSYTFGTNREEFLIVLDSLDMRVSKFSLQGKLLQRKRVTDWGVTSAQLQFVAIDYFAQVLITDRTNHCLWKLDRNLHLLARFGKHGSGEYQFDEPRGIALYRRFGQIFVAEREGAQYFWIGVDILNQNVSWNPERRSMKFSAHITEPAYVTADLIDASGKLVTRISTVRVNTGKMEQEWDAIARDFPRDGLTDAEASEVSRIKNGNPIPAGSYRLRLTAKATYSSNRDFSREISMPVRL